jgi:hypothetical protein
MERRHFLKVAFGFAAGATVLAGTARAAPLIPQLPAKGGLVLGNEDIHPAVTSSDEVDRLRPEEVRWGRRRWGYRRHWGWRRRRHWGWHRRHWRRRWRRRYW